MSSTLMAGMKKVAAGQQVQVADNATKTQVEPIRKVPPATVMIGAHFSPEVRRTLLLIQAEPENQGKNLKQLLGEAINDLAVKYRKPQPYSGEAV